MTPEARARTRRAAENVTHYLAWLEAPLAISLARALVVGAASIEGPQARLLEEKFKLAVRELGG